MIMNDKMIIVGAMEKSPEFASYAYAREFDIHNFNNSLDTSVMPMVYIELLKDVWAEQLKGSYPKVDLDKVTEELLNEDEKLEWNEKRQISKFIEFRDEVTLTFKRARIKANSLPALQVQLSELFRKNLGDRCWLYILSDKSNVYIPHLVESVTYSPKSKYKSYSSVDIKLIINKEDSTSSITIEITNDDFREFHKNPQEIMKAKGLFFETKEMYDTYCKNYEDYLVKSLWQNKQIVCKGQKYIQDHQYNKENGRSIYSKSRSRKKLSDFSKDEELVSIPSMMEIYAFNLSAHEFKWLKSYELEAYVYDDSIAEKLILPEEHKDLINILLSDDIKELGSDIIKGKGAGTMILAKGRAGIGKTATSEIYSEKKQLPLYSVHSGQLSIKGENLEDKLKTIFKRAERWGCILLIDEADVFIRQRDNDINHNAIVASFLRTMEYYNGTLFMTTNREDDVDEAIESRCIAVLKYSLPDKKMRKKLWKLFTKQFGIDVDNGVYGELTDKMDNLSGRDIKNISMLASRYMQGKGIEVADFDVFKTCATFRGKYSI